MCQSVWWKAEPWPVEVESLGQFRLAFPGVEIIGDPGPSGDDCCLCPVDLDATFAKAGIAFHRPEHDMDYEVLRAPGSETASSPSLSPHGEGPNPSNSPVTQEGAQEPKEGGQQT